MGVCVPGGTVTSRYDGHAPDLLGSYEWYVATSGYRAHSVR